jgi:hypothetical protein
MKWRAFAFRTLPMPDPPPDVVARLKSDPTAACGGADPHRLVSRPRFVGDEGVWRQRGRKGAKQRRWSNGFARAGAKKVFRGGPPNNSRGLPPA